MKHKNFTLLLLLAFLKSGQSFLDPKLLMEIFKGPLDLQNPVMVDFGLTMSYHNIDLVKNFNKNMWSIKFTRSFESNDKMSPVIFVVKNAKDLDTVLNIADKENLGLTKNVLIVIQSMFQDVESNIRIRINQNIYFLILDSLRLYEAYKINGFVIQKTVGSYFWNSLVLKLQFQLEDNDWSQELGKRRGNFYGQHLIGIGMNEPPYSIFNMSYLTEARFFENNQTYDVTGFYNRGLAYDIVEELSHDLNFTFTVYTRKDQVWGNIHGNISTGMIDNLYRGDADIGVSSFGMYTSRFKGVDFLPSHYSYITALVVKRGQPEDFEWTMFVHPFHLELWLTMTLVSLTIAIWLCLSNHDFAMNENKVGNHNLRVQIMHY